VFVVFLLEKVAYFKTLTFSKLVEEKAGLLLKDGDLKTFIKSLNIGTSWVGWAPMGKTRGVKKRVNDGSKFVKKLVDLALHCIMTRALPIW
jgi:hypothetical protein